MTIKSITKIELPPNLKLLKSRAYNPIIVEIPLTASANRLALFVLSLVYLSGLPIGLLLSLGTLINLSNRDGSFIIYFGIIFIPIFVLISVFGVSVAIICIRDILMVSPSLIIDADYLHDRRSGARLRWCSCDHAEFLTDKRGISCVRLYLNREVKAKSNFFRVGSEFRMNRKFTLLVPIRMLNVRPYILAHSIAKIVQNHGGTAETTQWE